MLVRWTIILMLLLALFLPGEEATGQSPFRVYLTFEDGPTDAYTPYLLDVLAQYNARATFFINGWQIAGREAILQRMIREGHAIGNHLWEEPGLYAGAADQAVRDSYFRTEAALRGALGDMLPIYDQQVKLFRQPGGGWKPFPATEGVSVITYNWNVSGNDCGANANLNPDLTFNKRVLDNLFEHPHASYFNVYDYGDGVIVVLHDINRVTGRVLPEILQRLAESGASFEALPRPGDPIGTMPVALGVPPITGAGIPGTTLPGNTLNNSRIRTAPALNASILIESVPMNTPLLFTGRAKGWYQVLYEGQSGWIYADNVQITGPIPNLPLLE